MTPVQELEGVDFPTKEQKKLYQNFNYFRLLERRE